MSSYSTIVPSGNTLDTAIDAKPRVKNSGPNNQKSLSKRISDTTKSVGNTFQRLSGRDAKVNFGGRRKKTRGRRRKMSKKNNNTYKYSRRRRRQYF
jgi:hypothetical protein